MLMTPSRPFFVRIVTAVQSTSPTLPTAGSVSTLPVAWSVAASSSRIQRKMSKSWISMSLKMPPELLMYGMGGAPGSRLVTISISGVPISPAASRALAAENVGSKRRWNPIMQVTPDFATASAQVLELGVVMVAFLTYPSKFGAFGAYGGAGVDDVDTGLFGATLDVPAFQPGQGQVGVLGGPVVVVVVRDRFAENGFGLQGVVGGGGWWVRGFGQVECGGVRG